MAGKPTLVTLARDLGVSRQTVSNALNAPHRVNPATLERVLGAIAESGYRPSVAGRQLRTRRSMNLALRLHPSDGINGSVLDRFLHALTEAAQHHGYRLTLFTAADVQGEVAAMDELLSSADIDGFVLTSTHHGDARAAWLLANSVPFVSFGRPWSADSDPFSSAHAWVDVDGGAGTAEASQVLLDLGHERVGFLGWPAGSGVGDDRRHGWARTLRAAGATDTDLETWSVSLLDTVADGARGARDLLRRGVTAVVCASDSLALGALSAWGHPGVALSGPPRVIGFDDTPVAAAIGLSSVRQPIERAAQHAADVLRHQLSGRHLGPTPETHLLLPSVLVERTTDPALTANEATPRQPGTHHKETDTSC